MYISVKSWIFTKIKEMKPKNKNKTKIAQDKNMKPKKHRLSWLFWYAWMHVVSVQKDLDFFYHERCFSGPCSVENPDSRNWSQSCHSRCSTGKTCWVILWSCESAPHWEHNYSGCTTPATMLFWKKRKRTRVWVLTPRERNFMQHKVQCKRYMMRTKAYKARSGHL